MDSFTPSSKQLDIIHYLYRFRFLTSVQLQQLLTDKSSRLTNYHLKNLCTASLISKHFSRKQWEGNQPAVYYLSPGSINILHSQLNIPIKRLQRIYRERIRSSQFISQSRFIADYFLTLSKRANTTNSTLHFFTQTDLLNHPYILRPIPDAYAALVDDKRNTKRYFIEVFDEGAPRFILRKRIEQYNEYIESGEFEIATHHPFPAILLICPTVAMLMYLKKHIAKIWDESSYNDISLYISTKDGALAQNWEPITEESYKAA